MRVTTKVTEYAVTKGKTTLYVRDGGIWWAVKTDDGHVAPFATLEEAIAAAEKWVLLLEQARLLRQMADEIYRETVLEISETPAPVPATTTS